MVVPNNIAPIEHILIKMLHNNVMWAGIAQLV
jgi:hypothetical protein